MPQRPCLVCGRLTRNPSRCDVHQAEYMAARNARRGSANARGYTAEYRKRAAYVLAQHRATHGEHCPGYRVPAHVSSDLTVDHIVPLAKGGTHELSNLSVLCRACNARKRDHI